MLKAIIFDFDGVVVDSEPLHHQAFVQVSQTLGVTFDYAQYVKRFIGYDDRDVFGIVLDETGDDSDGDERAQLIAALCEQKQQAFEELVTTGQVPTIPGSLALIDEAAARLPIAIASGATQRDIDIILEQLGILDRFPVIVTADDVSKSKPDPQTYQLAAEQLARTYPQAALQPGQCLAIEDTAAGLLAAQAAGLMTLALTTSSLPDELNNAQRIIPDLEDVQLDQLIQWYQDA